MPPSQVNRKALIAAVALIAGGMFIPLGAMHFGDAVAVPHATATTDHRESETPQLPDNRMGTHLEFRNNTGRCGRVPITFQVLDVKGNLKATLAPGDSYGMSDFSGTKSDLDVDAYIAVDNQKRMEVAGDNQGFYWPQVACKWRSPGKPERWDKGLNEYETATYDTSSAAWWVCRGKDTNEKYLVIELWKVPNEKLEG